MTELSSIRDRVAVVTGGAAGIGLACAQRFISEGAKVAILDRDVEAGDRIARDFNAKGGTAISIGAECTSDDDMQTAVAEIVAKWGRLDILAGCAGGFHDAPAIEDLDAEAWRAGIEWNLSGVYLPMRAVVPAMKANGYGRIVNIGSQAGRTSVPTAAIDYSAAKAAVAGLSRRVASELASFGITVNTIMPGPILTPRFAGLHGELMNQLEHAVPAGRLGKPEEIAYAVWFLCAPGAAFTTGATLDVNGGGWTG